MMLELSSAMISNRFLVTGQAHIIQAMDTSRDEANDDLRGLTSRDEANDDLRGLTSRDEANDDLRGLASWLRRRWAIFIRSSEENRRKA